MDGNVRAGYYRNEPLSEWPTGGLKVRWEEASDIIKKHVVTEAPLDNLICGHRQNVMIDLVENMLYIGAEEYPVASGKNTPSGLFYVVEKWEYPYYRTNGSVFLPGESNPLGDYLIIFGDADSGKKIPYSMHMWPKSNGSFLNRSTFKQGEYTNGCIRTKSQDIEEVFRRIQLGDLVSIHNKQ